MAKKTAVATEEKKGPKRDTRGTPYYDVKGAAGTTICRVGNYSDPIINEANGIQRFLDFLPVFSAQMQEGKWAGFILDSMSFAALAARKYHQYELNPDTSNPLQWHGGGTDIIEEVACLQLPALACHVGAIFHVHTRKTEESDAKTKSTRQPFVPGRRMEETKMVSAAWPELWRIHIQNEKSKTEEGKVIRRRYLQTEGSQSFQAGTTIGMPDATRVSRVIPENFVWQGYAGKGQRPEVHVAVYGDPQAGKTQLLSQVMRQLCAPVPFYVALFDARGKDVPYRLLGTVA